MSAPMPPGSPPPPQWMPMPTHAPRMNLWPALAWWGRVVGFLLLFLGTVLVVGFASVPGGCATQPSSCGTNFLAGVLNAILVGKVFWTIGLLFIAGATAIRMHYTMQSSSSLRPEEVVRGTHDRWMNTVVILTSIVLLFLLMWTVNLVPPVIPTVP